MDNQKIEVAVRTVRAVLSGKATLAAASAALQQVDETELGLVAFAARAPLARVQELRAMGQLALPVAKK